MTTLPQLPPWTQEASFGIFVHWGPYSVPSWAVPSGAWGEVPEDSWFANTAYAEWYANTVRIAGSPTAVHQNQAYEGAPYDDFLDAWKAEEYDPQEWAALFSSAGADYVIPVTKHHDGVTLWDAPGAGDLTTVARGPRRDLISPLADAVRVKGLRFGVYYSGGLDWAFSDFPPIESMEQVYKYRPVDDGYAKYATAHVRDLIDRYQPSILWNDIEWPDAGKADGSLLELMRHYRHTVPDGVVNDRWGMEVWDYRTSEYAHGTEHEVGSGWEHNRGLGFSFGFNRLEDEAQTLTPRELARLYADVVSRGGRLLLNIGPEASGAIPEIQRRTLEGIAPWMAQVKPFTANRGPVEPGSVVASSMTTEQPWFRAWQSQGRVIVVVDSEDTVITAAGDLLRFTLPAAPVPR